jgi:thiamine biosynthesis lipoprotein
VLEADAAVATSGCYERGRHLVDPKGTGGVEETASATVTGPSLAFADAFATALAVGGDDALDVIATLDGYEGYLIRADGSERTTAGIVLG